MNNIERRNANIAYISDSAVFEEQKVCRRILQRLNTADADDFDTHRAIVRELFGDPGHRKGENRQQLPVRAQCIAVHGGASAAPGFPQFAL